VERDKAGQKKILQEKGIENTRCRKIEVAVFL
jgi:hypothetical protein